MKQIKKILLATLFLTILFAFNACDDDDTNPPVIELNAPIEGAILKIGSKIHFDMDLKGHHELRSYKVEIHNNFDNHGNHTKSESAETVPFAFNRVWDDVAGHMNKHVHHHDIEIPVNTTEGKYHFMVYCSDIEGNESYVVRNIELRPEGDDGHHD